MITISNCINDLEKRGFKKKNIFILGFSQGAIFSLWFIIKQKYSLGGCISIAGGFNKKVDFISENLSLESKQTPILLMHGEKDKIIPPKESKNTYDIFLNLGFNVELFLYSTGHKIPLKAKKTIWNFLINQTNNLT
jgi:phospholipase/carboxylesterase